MWLQVSRGNGWPWISANCLVAVSGRVLASVSVEAEEVNNKKEAFGYHVIVTKRESPQGDEAKDSHNYAKGGGGESIRRRGGEYE